MAYNEHLEARVGEELTALGEKFVAKKMFGGVCFMVDDKMCCGIVKEDLMLRVQPEDEAEFLKEDSVRLMDFVKSRPMKGFLYVNADGYESKEKMRMYIKACIKCCKAAVKKKR